MFCSENRSPLFRNMRLETEVRFERSLRHDDIEGDLEGREHHGGEQEAERSLRLGRVHGQAPGGVGLRGPDGS